MFQKLVQPPIPELRLIVFLFYYSYVHTRLGTFLPPDPTPSLTTHSAPSLFPPPPQYPAETILPLISNFVEERV
jgi:hypothetical protein